MCIIDSDFEFLLEADIIGTKIAFPNSDKKHCWGVKILHINKKVNINI